jgi:hypothetical protein
MKHLGCRYLGKEVELTEERERHIADRHPDLLPNVVTRIEETLADPDEVCKSRRFGSARLFFRRFTGSKGVIVVVVGQTEPTPRHWVITAYQARKPPAGDLEWKRS